MFQIEECFLQLFQMQMQINVRTLEWTALRFLQRLEFNEWKKLVLRWAATESRTDSDFKTYENGLKKT